MSPCVQEDFFDVWHGEVGLQSYIRPLMQNDKPAGPDSKTGDPRRVPLSSRALAVLDALPRRMDGEVWGVRADSITQAFARACHRAGIEDLRFHDLRHEATSRFFEKGLNPMQVAAITGHKTLQMLKRYTHLRAEDLAKILG
ncbi:site-specific integrase [Acidithiobacillus sp. 'AMD consortium']|uniref:Site-specific integrase n=2 Tax=Acidithiobacillus ferridurans TaxID=1232575 RepID=A0A8X8G5K0_ACIFI|nr:site-specific integrase [Acidithiobacillus ferridurans]MBU2722234.1 site-specific integrase [Acidithiobacillus ferridurans]MBU2726898.1 site-specific integrase [Acidithiobacillus ferridurans]QFG79788.1 site-specific integrase [Acidithiobacillus sp. 'AMD consortium']BBF65303.1 Tyrosine recombinase XerC [Acidithiobacillus ferridurans]